MISAAFTGGWIKSGRRRVLIILSFVGIIGAAITLIQNFYAILIGRLFYGFSVGMISITMPRYMEENVPNNLVGFFGGLYCLSFAIATLIAYAMAVILPPDTDEEALKATHGTQVVFGLPIVFYIFQLILLFTYFKRDSVKFLLLSNDEEGAVTEVARIYER